MIKNARVALIASLFLGGCFVDDPVMFDICKSDADCKGTVALSQCRTISVAYDSGTATESFCTAGCSNAGGNCSFYSANGQLAYCAGQDASGAFTTGPFTTAVCMETCRFHSDCNVGFICADNKLIAIQPGVSICIPGTFAIIPDTAPYDYCESSSECHSTASTCMDISAKWDEDPITYTAPMCSRTCVSDLDCPDLTIGLVTYNGTCLPAGVVSSTSACAQGCINDNDCIEGFRCADDKELIGIEPGGSVCVPMGN